MAQTILSGIVKRHPDGFGFVIPDNHEEADVYIPRRRMTGIMSNDRLKVEVKFDKQHNRNRGYILEILERSVKTVVGKFAALNNHEGLVLDTHHKWGCDLRIAKKDSLNAKNGELCLIEIISYPDESQDFTGRVVEVLGEGAEAQHDARRVLFSHDIPQVFPQEVIVECNDIPSEVRQHDYKDRKDLRELPFVTIDGVTAKDFDDAVYVETRDTGFHLWVAIADVSHYVKPGTKIDQEAYERGNSTYFPGLCVPMLPEKLSNDLCSLNPHVPRLAFVAEIDFDFTGETQKTDFYEAVIESHARVTYGEAQEVIEGKCPEKLEHVEAAISRAADLAKVLMAKRFKEGSLDLDIPETEVIIDEAGNVEDIIKAERVFSHRLIEELMLAANVAAANRFVETETQAIYRVHDSPTADKLEILNRFIEKFGESKTIAGGKIQKKISRMLQKFAGKPYEQILHILTLRSMTQAQYAFDNVGHFGLGFENYTHFTSPIRRYPDLIVHRQLKSVLLNADNNYATQGEEDLRSAGTHLSATEQRSVKAERHYLAIKKARFMEPYIGQEFKGIVSSVTKFGIFVLLRKFDVDGLVKIDDLGGDKFEFDEENLELVGKKTGLSYQIGETVEVIVAAADPEHGQVDFVLKGVQPGGTTDNGTTNRKDSQKRRKAKNNRRRFR
jgi:ribonuclease R